MLPEYIAIVGAFIACLGEFKYLYETLRGTIQPNRVSWLLWAIFPLIIFAAQRSQGVDALSWLSLVAGSTAALIFGATFLNKQAYWKTRPLDYVCMGFAILGMLLWALTDEPNIAIALSIVADFAAAVPTLLKTYHHPETEDWSAYALAAFGCAISLLAVHQWTLENYGFVLYLGLNNLMIMVLALRRSGVTHNRKKKKRNADAAK